MHRSGHQEITLPLSQLLGDTTVSDNLPAFLKKTGCLYDILSITFPEPGIVVHTFNPAIEGRTELEAPLVPGQPGMHRETPSQKKQKTFPDLGLEQNLPKAI